VIGICSSEVVGVEERLEALSQLIVACVVMAPHGRVLDRPVHPFDLAVRPRMVRLGQAMIDVVLRAGEREGMAAKARLLGEEPLDLGRRPAVALGVGEVRAVIGERRVDAMRDGVDQSAQEVCRHASRRTLVQLGEGELAGAIDGDEHVELAFLGPRLGDVDVEEADGVGSEFLLRLPALDVGRRLMSCRWNSRCSDDRVRCGIVACSA